MITDQFDFSCVDKFDFLCTEQKAFSENTFGPSSHRGPHGPLEHLKREAKEAQDAQTPENRLSELADCLILVLDAAWRANINPDLLLSAALVKVCVNRNRKWPDWRNYSGNAVLEHNREEEK